MATSTLPAAKSALVGLVAAALPGVQVEYGDPGLTKLEREAVFFAGTGEDGQRWAPIGALAKDETYAITGYMHVANKGDNQQAATERAFVIFGVIESTLRPLMRDLSVVADGVYYLAVAPNRLDEWVGDEGYAAFIHFEVEIKARI